MAAEARSQKPVPPLWWRIGFVVLLTLVSAIVVPVCVLARGLLEGSKGVSKECRGAARYWTKELPRVLRGGQA